MRCKTDNSDTKEVKGMQGAHAQLYDLIVRYGYFVGGQFTLSSGETSDIYFDLRRVTMHPSGASVISHLMLERLPDIDAAGGMESGAIPIATAIALQSGTIRAFYIRKEEKMHGRGRLVEGCLKNGDIVGLVEDVTTSGRSVLSAIRAVEQLDCTVTKVISVLDRQSGAKELIESAGYRFESLCVASDFTTVRDR
ncbi:MAG: orotate phosphoribosyltransferase [Halobacteriota archaeon]